MELSNVHYSSRYPSRSPLSDALPSRLLNRCQPDTHRSTQPSRRLGWFWTIAQNLLGQSWVPNSEYSSECYPCKSDSTWFHGLMKFEFKWWFIFVILVCVWGDYFELPSYSLQPNGWIWRCNILEYIKLLRPLLSR